MLGRGADVAEPVPPSRHLGVRGALRAVKRGRIFVIAQQADAGVDGVLSQCADVRQAEPARGRVVMNEAGASGQSLFDRADAFERADAHAGDADIRARPAHADFGKPEQPFIVGGLDAVAAGVLRAEVDAADRPGIDHHRGEGEPLAAEEFIESDFVRRIGERILGQFADRRAEAKGAEGAGLIAVAHADGEGLECTGVELVARIEDEDALAAAGFEAGVEGIAERKTGRFAPDALIGAEGRDLFEAWGTADEEDLDVAEGLGAELTARAFEAIGARDQRHDDADSGRCRPWHADLPRAQEERGQGFNIGWCSGWAASEGRAPGESKNEKPRRCGRGSSLQVEATRLELVTSSMPWKRSTKTELRPLDGKLFGSGDPWSFFGRGAGFLRLCPREPAR